MLSPYEPDPEWSGGRVTLPDGTTFMLAINGNKIRIRHHEWVEFEGNLGPLGPNVPEVADYIIYRIWNEPFVEYDIKPPWKERIRNFFRK